MSAFKRLRALKIWSKTKLKQYFIENSIIIHSVSLATVPGFFPLKAYLKTVIEPSIVCKVQSNSFGNQLQILLPIHTGESFKNKNKLLYLILNAIQFAYFELKVSCFTFLGTLPSATNYILDIYESLKIDPALSNNIDHIHLTTGHATTLACVTINCEYILNKTNRRMKNEIVGILGCGSIGYGSILTIISTLSKNNYPKKILLSDIQIQNDRMIELKKKLQIIGYNGDIDVVISFDPLSVNELFYDCTLIIGAINKSNVLDPDKLKNGCIIIDDSAPHAFDENKAWKRFKNKKDIFFSEAGLVKLPDVCDNAKSQKQPKSVNDFSSTNHVFSCMLGGMLLYKFPNKVKPICGAVKYQDGVERLKLLKQIGVEGCAFYFGYTPKLFGKLLSLSIKEFNLSVSKL